MDDQTQQEIAKTTSKAIEAARDFGGFIAKMIEGPLEQGMGIFEDKLRYLRWERQVRFRHKVEQVLTEHGLDCPTRPVPLQTAIPLFQSASVEDNDDLQDRYAYLLANAADSTKSVVHRGYVRMLSELEPFDAQILDKIYSSASGDRGEEIYTLELPEKVVFEKPEVENLHPSLEVEVSLGNLARLGCITSAMAWGGMAIFSTVHTTKLGWEFYRSCQP